MSVNQNSKRKSKSSQDGSYMKILKSIDCYDFSNILKRVVTNLCPSKTLTVNNFKEHVITKWSGLSEESDQSVIVKLRKVFKFLSFKDGAIKSHKLRAIIAGSFPAWLANSVKKAQDVDIVVLVDMKGLMSIFSNLFVS